MLHSTLNFNKIPGFSKLFIDFINDSEFFRQRFPANKSLLYGTFDFENFTFPDERRLILMDLISKSTIQIDYSSHQKNNFNLVGKSDTFAVVTGQQVGFLGGPVYTILKAFSAVELAKKLKGIYPKKDFVPIFWVEDNDHDLIEASVTRFFNKEWNISVISSSDENNSPGVSVSELKYVETALIRCKEFIENSQQTEFTGDLANLFDSVYRSGTKMNDAFVLLMNHYLQYSGMLFLKASEVRKSGIWKELVLKELETEGGSDSTIQNANRLLEMNGYHLQAKSFNTNLFIQLQNKRFKINHLENKSFSIADENFSKDTLISIADKNPELFSPNVLLRPLFQDFAIPTAAYIGGPSEIGYCAQITDLYKQFQITMPAFYMRHSATFVNQKFQRYLEKSSNGISFYLRKFHELENDFNSGILNNDIEDKFDVLKEKIREVYEELNLICSETDKTLVPASVSAMEKSIQLLEHLHGKIKTAEKRKYSTELNRLKQMSFFLFPDGALQERIFTFLSFVNLAGENKFREYLNDIVSLKADSHIIYYI